MWRESCSQRREEGHLASGNAERHAGVAGRLKSERLSGRDSRHPSSGIPGSLVIGNVRLAYPYRRRASARG
jgi:hypothetical protein